MKSRLTRGLPALGVIALLALGAARPQGPTMPVPGPPLRVQCLELDPSRMNLALPFLPPFVTRSIAGVADPPSSTVALEVRTDPDTRGASLPSGVYFVRARDSSGGQVTRRVVVVR